MEELIIVTVCLGLNGLFAAYEMAFVSISKSELKRLAKEGRKDAQRILELRESPERTLSIIQIGITLVGVVSAAVSGAGASESIEPYLEKSFGISNHAAEILSIALVAVPLTYLSVVVGELVPKSLALKNPVKITFLGVPFLIVADKFLSPIVSFLEWSTKLILGLFFPKSRQGHSAAETSLEIGALPQHHQQAILNLAHIERRKIKDIFVPWKDVNHVRKAETMEEVAPVVFASGHTRLPVVDEGRVVGILHTKEFLALRETGKSDWAAILRPALTVSPEESVVSVLRLMQRNRNHMAIVVSRSDCLGIVTLEDISEEVWGDIFDEDDESHIRKIFADRVKMKMKPPGA